MGGLRLPALLWIHFGQQVVDDGSVFVEMNFQCFVGGSLFISRCRGRSVKPNFHPIGVKAHSRWKSIFGLHRCLGRLANDQTLSDGGRCFIDDGSIPNDVSATGGQRNDQGGRNSLYHGWSRGLFVKACEIIPKPSVTVKRVTAHLLGFLRQTFPNLIYSHHGTLPGYS